MKSENEMTDEELDQHEHAVTITEDVWDRLELLRRILNSSHLEKMYHLKRGTTLGPACPYYKKALRLFDENQKQQIVDQLRNLLKELE